MINQGDGVLDVKAQIDELLALSGRDPSINVNTTVASNAINNIAAEFGRDGISHYENGGSARAKINALMSGPAWAGDSSLYLDFVNNRSWTPYVGVKSIVDRLSISRASTGTYFDANGVMQAAPVDQWRRDYNPANMAALGVLIEEQRTNTFANSADLSAWTLQGLAQVALNVSAAPNGLNEFDRLSVSTTASGIAYLRRTITLPAGVSTVSIYGKPDGYQNIMFRLNAGSDHRINFNLNDGSVNGLMPGISRAFAQNVGGGVYRCVLVTDTLTAANYNFDLWIQPSSAASLSNQSLTAGLGVQLWGLQSEAGSFPTSYIPTTTAAATRAADVVSAVTSPWYNDAEGTVFVAGDATSDDGDRTIFSMDNGLTTQAEQIDYRGVASSNQIYPRVRNTAANSYAPALAHNFANRAEFRLAMAMKSGSWASSLNGALSDTSASATPMPVSISRLRIGMRGSEAQRFCGHIKRLQYYPRRLTNAELQQVTA